MAMLFVIVLLIDPLVTTIASSTLSIEPAVHKAIEVGDTVEFVCTRSDNGTAENIVWTFSKTGDVITATPSINTTPGQPKQSPPSSSSSSPSSSSSSQRSVTNVNGTLKIQSAEESDKGTYVCSVADPGNSEKESVKLVVYVMPDYTEELTGIGVTCLVVVTLLILLTVRKHKTAKNRKRAWSANTKTETNAAFDNNGSTPGVQIYMIEKDGKKECEF